MEKTTYRFIPIGEAKSKLEYHVEYVIKAKNVIGENVKYLYYFKDDFFCDFDQNHEVKISDITHVLLPVPSEEREQEIAKLKNQVKYLTKALETIVLTKEIIKEFSPPLTEQSTKDGFLEWLQEHHDRLVKKNPEFFIECTEINYIISQYKRLNTKD